MADRKACPPQKYENLVTPHIIKELYIQEPVQGNQNTINSASMPFSHTHFHTHAGFGGTLHTPPADSTRRAGARHPAQGEPGFDSVVSISPIMHTIHSHIHIHVCLSTSHHIPSHPIPSLCTWPLR